MKAFVDYHLRAQRTDPDWSNHYVDYVHLKEILRSFQERRLRMGKVVNGDGYVTYQDLAMIDRQVSDSEQYVKVKKLVDTVGNSDNFKQVDIADYFKYDDDGKADGTFQQIHVDEAMYRLAWWDRTEFSDALDKEVKKAATFCETLETSLAQILADMEGSDVVKEKLAHPNNCDDDYLHQQIINAGDEILESVAFFVVNIITLRQILIRYDAFVRTFDGMPLSNWYMEKRDWDDDSGRSFQDIFHTERFNSFHSSFLNSAIVQDVKKTPSEAMSTYLSKFADQYDEFMDLLDKTLHSVRKTAKGRVTLKDRIIENARYYFLLGSQKHGLSLEPKFLLMRGRNLKKEIKTVVAWRERGEGVADDGETDESNAPEQGNFFPLVLNLISCFLYTMGIYIVEPSSAYYVSALGANEAMTGMVVGAKQWATLVSAFGYSYWTNYSFKTPLLFASFLLLIGNLIYACAYTYKSIEMCILGRFVAGLGATRMINRRYIADTTPFSLRTWANAAFGLSKALGSALGPGAAVVLDLFNFEFELPFLGRQYFNGMTGPGYFMVILWAIFIVVVALTFDEPKRIGLDELREREDTSKSTLKNNLIENSELSPGSMVEQITVKERTNSYGSDTDLEGRLPDFDVRAESSSQQNCFKKMTRAVWLCLLMIFFKRVSLDSIVASTSLITKNRYGWPIKNVGLLHFANGIIVIPITMMAGWQSQFHEDRFLTLRYLFVILMGLFVLLDFSDFASHDNEGYNQGQPLAVGPVRYIIGSLIAFSGIEACECFVASLTSKLMPSALETGTFNSGLLVTSVTVGGAAFGGALITAMAYISIRNLLNLLIIPSILMIIVSIVLVRLNYHLLAV